MVKAYTVIAKIEAECDVEVKAESLEEALEKGRKLTVPDFVKATSGTFNDFEKPHIIGVWE